MSEPQPDSPSARLGPYTLLSKLGRGGMGEVHLALDPRLDALRDHAGFRELLKRQVAH